MNYSEIVSKVSEDTGITADIVDRIYKSFWLFVKDTIQNLPLKDNLNEEDFNKLRTNFNIPSLGKLTCTYQRYIGVKERFRHIKKLREKL